MSSTDALSSYESRRETFFRTEEAVKSRKKTQTIVWPHPIPTNASNASSSSSLSTSTSAKSQHRRSSSFPSPSELALYGLYFTPSTSSKEDDETHDDVCTLYPEGDVVSSWKAGDNVVERIRGVNPEAAFVLIADSRDAGKEEKGKEKHVWSWTEEHLLPTSKHMVEARLRTFAAFWPYDGKKGWKPTSKKVAAAGFYFNPNDDEQDCVTCAYCDCSLGGWEKGDDPVKEHQRRRPECAFFNCTVVQAVAAKEVGAKSRAVSTSVSATKQPRARAVSKRKAKEVDEADDEEEAKESANAKEATAETSEGAETEAGDQKRSTSRTKKQATGLTDDAVKIKASSSSSSTTKTKKASSTRKVSTKVPTHEQERDEPALEEPTSPTPMDEEATKETAKPAESEQNAKTDKEPRSSSAAIERARSSTQQQSTVSAQGKEVGSHGSEELNKEPTSAKPFSIPPLTSLTNITPKEEQMTVEAWLRLQVEDACAQMQREGDVRIQRLEDEISQGRTKIEAILRGTQKPLGSTA